MSEIDFGDDSETLPERGDCEPDGLAADPVLSKAFGRLDEAYAALRNANASLGAAVHRVGKSLDEALAGK